MADERASDPAGDRAGERVVDRAGERATGRVKEDDALLHAWRLGDRRAGNLLFERYYPSVARFFRNKVNEAAQEDLIHDTFLGCLRGVPGFREQASFRTYLFAIARNALADHLRRRGRAAARAPQDEDADVDEVPAAAYGPSPIAAAVQHEEQRLLLEALRRIPLIHQIALELHYWEDLTTSEISEVLEIPLGTAKTRLFDGRLHLEEQLRQIARSSEVLQSTLDDLDQWVLRVRAQLSPLAGAGRLARRAGELAPRAGAAEGTR
jgi:RNA polymerase sigma-70 factor (ECF subfamily)